MEHISKVELRSPSGLYLGEANALEFQRKRVNPVIRRIVRGLLWHHYGIKLRPEIKFLIWKDPDIGDIADILNNMTTLSSIGDTVFQYRHNILVEDPEMSIWVLRFYTKTTFLTILMHESEVARLAIIENTSGE